MRWSLSTGILTVVLLAALFAVPGARAQGAGFEADLDLVVEMPLAVADALDAGVPVDDLSRLSRSLIDGEVPPSDFIEVITLAPLVYELDRVAVGREVPVRAPARDRAGDRRAAVGPGLGAYVQRQLDRGLRGRELARAIHRELHRRGLSDGPDGRRVGVRGGDRVALDLRDLRVRDPRDRARLRERFGDDDERVDRRRPDRRDGPPGQLKKRDRGKDEDVPPGHARGRGRGHGKGHDQEPPPHARGGPDRNRGDHDGGER